MNTRNLYLRFLNLVNAIDGVSAVATVDTTALRLLDEIAVAHSKGEPMTVTKAMLLSNIASPATLHRKMDDLREANLIDQIFEGTNRRTKYLVPTKSAEQYFTSLGEKLTLASASTTVA